MLPSEIGYHTRNIEERIKDMSTFTEKRSEHIKMDVNKLVRNFTMSGVQ